MASISHYPAAFIKRLQSIVPKIIYNQVLEQLGVLDTVSFRINTLLAGSDEVLPILKQEGFALTQVAWYPYAYTIPMAQREQLTYGSWLATGKIVIQSLSSLLPPLVLAPEPGEEILDLTAAPGSKTTQMATMIQGKGRIAAVEKVKGRFFKLRANLKKQSITCVDTYLQDGCNIWRPCENRFDRVLLDAPCSSEGHFIADDVTSYVHWSERKVKEMARKQWRLLYSAFRSLKPGGILVYSTCTFAPEENETTIQWLIQQFADQVEILPIKLPFDNIQPGLTQWQDQRFDERLMLTCRILPTMQMTPFYIAKIRKAAEKIYPHILWIVLWITS